MLTEKIMRLSPLRSNAATTAATSAGLRRRRSVCFAGLSMLPVHHPACARESMALPEWIRSRGPDQVLRFFDNNPSFGYGSTSNTCGASIQNHSPISTVASIFVPACTPCRPVVGSRVCHLSETEQSQLLTDLHRHNQQFYSESAEGVGRARKDCRPKEPRPRPRRHSVPTF